jgi:hypothetical protein
VLSRFEMTVTAETGSSWSGCIANTASAKFSPALSPSGWRRPNTKKWKTVVEPGIKNGMRRLAGELGAQSAKLV